MPKPPQISTQIRKDILIGAKQRQVEVLYLAHAHFCIEVSIPGMTASKPITANWNKSNTHISSQINFKHNLQPGISGSSLYFQQATTQECIVHSV